MLEIVCHGGWRQSLNDVKSYNTIKEFVTINIKLTKVKAQMLNKQRWAAILKNVLFKAIQIHNFREKKKIKWYNFVGQNFFHRWSDRKKQTKIVLHRWSDKISQNLWISLMKRHKFLDTIGLILCYKATFLSIQTYFPSDEATQSVQKPIFWSDAVIQYPKVQGTKVLVAHFSNYSLTLCNL